MSYTLYAIPRRTLPHASRASWAEDPSWPKLTKPLPPLKLIPKLPGQLSFGESMGKYGKREP